jgi:hypothetical protein
VLAAVDSALAVCDRNGKALLAAGEAAPDGEDGACRLTRGVEEGVEQAVVAAAGEKDSYDRLHGHLYDGRACKIERIAVNKYKIVRQ